MGKIYVERPISIDCLWRSLQRRSKATRRGSWCGTCGHAPSWQSNREAKKKTYRKCSHCGRRFCVDPRVGRLHRYCGRLHCAKASRIAAQKRWLREERRRGRADNVDVIRMQHWRNNHPGYWRQKIRVGRYEVRGKLADVVREFALQDMIDTHFSLVVGLASYLARSALQDTIASEMRRLMLLGHGILTQSAKAADPSPENGGD